MSLTKRCLKSKSITKVTFRLPRAAADGAVSVHLVGDFNNWDKKATPMQKLKNGDFKTILDLEPDQDYQYRYLIDNSYWENDWQADEYRPTNYEGTENSVVVI